MAYLISISRNVLIDPAKVSAVEVDWYEHTDKGA